MSPVDPVPAHAYGGLRLALGAVGKDAGAGDGDRQDRRNRCVRRCQEWIR